MGYTLPMKEYKKELPPVPEEILAHLKGIVRDTALPDTEDTMELLVRAWSEKEALFNAQTSNLGLLDTPSLSEEDSRGLLLLTNSGSLISLYTRRDHGRDLEYASISLRLDVPEIIKGNETTIEGMIESGKSLELAGSPLKKSSPVYRIAVCPEGLSPEEQDIRIREATIFLTNGFVRINKQITNPGSPGVDHFTN